MSTNDITGDSITSKPNSDLYRENFDAIFRKKARRTYHHTPETKAKISKAKKGRKLPPETVEKIRRSKLGKKRKPFSEEHRAKIAAKAKGRVFSEETLNKLRGRKRSPETIERIRQAKLGKKYKSRKKTEEPMSIPYLIKKAAEEKKISERGRAFKQKCNAAVQRMLDRFKKCPHPYYVWTGYSSHGSFREGMSKVGHKPRLISEVKILITGLQKADAWVEVRSIKAARREEEKAVARAMRHGVGGTVIKSSGCVRTAQFVDVHLPTDSNSFVNLVMTPVGYECRRVYVPLRSPE